MVKEGDVENKSDFLRIWFAFGERFSSEKNFLLDDFIFLILILLI